MATTNPEPVREHLSTPFFPGANVFRNCIHSTNLAIWDYLAHILFADDLKRVIYASSDYAFRKRAGTQKANTLNFPFANFRIESGGLSINTDRRWFNHSAQVQGIFEEELKRKIRLQPVTLSYDSTLFVETELDLFYATNVLSFENGKETKITPVLSVTLDSQEHTLQNIGVVIFNLGFNTKYKENDWLEKNHIRTIDLNFNIQTFLIKENYSFGIPKKFVMDFSTRLGISEDYETQYQAIIDQINGETGELVETTSS